MMMTAVILSRYTSRELDALNQNVAKGMFYELDMRLKSVDSSLLTLAMTNDVADIASGKYTKGRLAERYGNFARQAQIARAACGYIEEIFLYMADTQRILTSSSIDAVVWVKNHIAGAEDQAADDFLRRIEAVHARECFRYEPQDEGMPTRILQVLPIPLVSSAPNVWLCAVLSPALFQAEKTDKEHAVLVLGDQGALGGNGGSASVLQALAEKMSVEEAVDESWQEWTLAGEGYSVLQRQNADRNLRYVYAASRASLKSTTRAIALLCVLLCVGTSLLVTLLALGISRRIYQPVGALLNALVARGRLNHDAKMDEMLAIGSILDEALMDNDRLRRTLEKLAPSVDEVSFHHVIAHADWEESARWLDSFQGKCLCTALIQLGTRYALRGENGAAERSILLCMAADLRARLSSRVAVRAICVEDGVCTLIDHSIEADHFRHWLSEELAGYETEALEKWGVVLRCAISENAFMPHAGQERVQLLRRLYGQCKRLQERFWLSNQMSGSLWHDAAERAEGDAPIWINFETETSIVRALRERSMKAWNLASLLIEMNTADGLVSQGDVEKLLEGLLELVYRVNNGRMPAEWGQARRMLLECDTLQESVSVLRSLYESVCRVDAEREGSVTLARLEEYINAHWKENIGLHDVSVSFGLSDSYFSMLCRNLLGESILDAINRRRISEACDCMNRGMSISEIPEAVGYGNYKTFSRYFRKFTQLTPSGYRGTIAEKEP